MLFLHAKKEQTKEMEEKKTIVIVRIPTQLHEKFVTLATNKGQVPSTVLERLIREYIINESALGEPWRPQIDEKKERANG